ncbi:helix-turn-helix transcriptional regulator, partial [Paenibacillus sp.]
CEQLFCDMLKHSFDLELVRDALSYIKQFLSVRLAILLPEMEYDLGALCNVQTYSTIEECHEAILPLLIRLCYAVQQQGPWCDAVADAAYYLCSNIQKDITLSEIAAYADAAPAYLSNLFHQQTGLTIKQYQQKIRLQYACRLLRTTDAKVSDIAKQSGFSDRRYFTKVFKETYGASPQEYRK